MPNLTPEDLNVLTRWDTPTICNALEIVVPERRGFGFTVEPLVCLDPGLPPIVGYARTATIRATAPAPGTIDRMPYYEYIASGAEPSIVVIEDLDPAPGVGAFWGEVNTAVHKGLGAAGVVTNGSFRDLPDSAPGFQVLAGHVGPSHAHVHVVDFQLPVSVHGMVVNHNDIIHADQHGAVVVPAAAVREIPQAVELISRRETIILEAARRPDFDIEKLKAATGNARDIH
ncbi:MAG: RraA family protein [Gammaproteobacteria bacterium]|nr:RraA family protein [Gammaproteobacteria bacterium]